MNHSSAWVQPSGYEPFPLQNGSPEIDLAAEINRLCDRIEQAEPHLHALLPEPDRRARLLREAAALPARFPDPRIRPALYGVPVGVKDIYRVDGFPTGAGSQLPPELFTGAEAAVVTQLKAQGALVLGKTVTTEFAYFEPGPTRNPHHPEHTPGGSSSGSAAAVAAGYCPLALGSQTVGSVIRPAAFCGVAGFKTSYGRVSLEGVIPYAPSLDHFGLFVRDVSALDRAVSAFLGPREGEVASELSSPEPGSQVLGIPEGPYLEQASPETLAAFGQQVAWLEAQGWTVRRLPVMEDIIEINARHQVVACGEMARVHADWFPRYESLYRPRTAAQIREGRRVTDAELGAARAGCLEFRAHLEAVMNEHGVRAWLCPAATGPAPAGLHATGDPVMNLPWTQAGLPVGVFPAGNAKNGLPLGIQCVGRFWADLEIARLTTQLGRVMKTAPIG